MRVLVACEESQRVCTAFRERGHEAYSCDIIECSGGHPEWHIQGDVIPLLNGDCTFQTSEGGWHEIKGSWDLIIAHPPCTYLTLAANRYYDVERYKDKARQRYRERYKAIVFFMQLSLCNCPRIAIENPIGIMSTAYKKPTQIIQPYEFGHPVAKSTCLWLKGLPALEPTEVVEPERIHSKGKSGGYSGNSWYVTDQNGKILSWKDPRTAIERSKTYTGIARAMAEQWG